MTASITPFPARKSLSTTVRFRVLARDGFTCRYCRRGPPQVELAVDHVHPVAKGGKNDFDNLVTACTECNYGKRDNLLHSSPPGESDAVPRSKGEGGRLVGFWVALLENDHFTVKTRGVVEQIFAIDGATWAELTTFSLLSGTAWGTEMVRVVDLFDKTKAILFDSVEGLNALVLNNPLRLGSGFAAQQRHRESGYRTRRGPYKPEFGPRVLQHHWPMMWPLKSDEMFCTCQFPGCQLFRENMS